MIITISSSQETGVSIYRFAKSEPKWQEVARLEPGKHQTLAVEAEEPALIVKWFRFGEGYQVSQIKVART